MGHRNIQLQVAARDQAKPSPEREAELAALSWPELRARAKEAGIAGKGKDRAALTAELLAK